MFARIDREVVLSDGTLNAGVVVKAIHVGHLDRVWGKMKMRRMSQLARRRRMTSCKYHCQHDLELTSTDPEDPWCWLKKNGERVLNFQERVFRCHIVECKSVPPTQRGPRSACRSTSLILRQNRAKSRANFTQNWLESEAAEKLFRGRFWLLLPPVLSQSARNFARRNELTAERCKFNPFMIGDYSGKLHGGKLRKVHDGVDLSTIYNKTWSYENWEFWAVVQAFIICSEHSQTPFLTASATLI